SVVALDRAPDKPNRHAMHDCGLASENLVIQATGFGMRVHMMAGFDPEKAAKIFEVPPRYEPLTMFAIGYPGEPVSLPEDLRQRETAPCQRKSLNEFVFAGKFGNSAGLE